MKRALEFAPIRRGVERLAAQTDVGALGHGETDEAHARIALAVRFAAGDRAGESFLAVEAEARGEDHVAGSIAGQGRPECLLNRLGSRSRPHHLLQAFAARPPCSISTSRRLVSISRRVTAL